MSVVQHGSGGPHGTGSRSGNLRIALMAGAVLVGMGGLTWASVPLYRVFCQATGFGGTAEKAAATNEYDMPILARKMDVSFNTDVAPGLPWTFVPEQHDVKVHVGEEKLVYFKAVNNSDQPITGRAVFNIVPYKAGIYFAKIECFCFSDQTLQPHQAVDMPVQFYVDPEIAKNPHLDDVKQITLSYTFFKAKS